MASAILAVAVALFAVGQAPAKVYTPTELAHDAASLDGRTVEVRGIVASHNATGKQFLLTDFETNLTVAYDTLPDGFAEDKEVLVRGVVSSNAGSVFLRAEKVTVGHAVDR